MKGRETSYNRHIVPVTSCSEVKYFLKKVSFVSKDYAKYLKLECAYFISDPLIVSKFHNETHDPKGQENKNLHYSEGQGDVLPPPQSQSPAVVTKSVF